MLSYTIGSKTELDAFVGHKVEDLSDSIIKIKIGLGSDINLRRLDKKKLIREIIAVGRVFNIYLYIMVFSKFYRRDLTPFMRDNLGSGNFDILLMSPTPRPINNNSTVC